MPQNRSVLGEATNYVRVQPTIRLSVKTRAAKDALQEMLEQSANASFVHVTVAQPRKPGGGAPR